jgi:predicted acetyltransferase
MPPEPEDARLVLPTTAYAESYLAALAEGYRDSSEGGDAQPSPRPDKVAWHISCLNRQGGSVLLPDGSLATRVPFAHLWMVAGGEFIGRVCIRYRLDEALRRWGGHMGYEVRPSWRRRGFGHRALALGLAHAREHGLRSLLLTCDEENRASVRIIERAGGVLEDVIPRPFTPGRRARRYWMGVDGTAVRSTHADRQEG